MAAKDIAVKKYVVKLSEAERNHLQVLDQQGKSPAKRLLKARILLKADAGAQGRVGAMAGSSRRSTPTCPW